MEEEIKKELLFETQVSKLNLSENEICQLAGVLTQIKEKIERQAIDDEEEIAMYIEDYMKSTVEFVDEEEECSFEEKVNNRYDTAYAALVMKKSSTLGVANAVKLILRMLDIPCRIVEFYNKEREYISYLVTDCRDDENIYYMIDPFNVLFCDKNLIRLDTLYDEGEFGFI